MRQEAKWALSTLNGAHFASAGEAGSSGLEAASSLGKWGEV